jgi:hypothetical protein
LLASLIIVSIPNIKTIAAQAVRVFR